MATYEYKVVPAPTTGLKAKGAKTSQARFANALETLMNELGAEGWDYIRADTLPCEERSGLTGRTTRFQNMLVFRRARRAAEDDVQVAGLLEAPAPLPASGPKEPPMSRRDPSQTDTSTAARAAAAAFRTFRGEGEAKAPAANAPKSGGPEPEGPRGVAAE